MGHNNIISHRRKVRFWGRRCYPIHFDPKRPFSFIHSAVFPGGRKRGFLLKYVLYVYIIYVAIAIAIAIVIVIEGEGKGEYTDISI